MKKNITLLFLFFFIFCLVEHSYGEDLEFANYSSTITRLDLELALFDLQVNRLDELPKDKFEHLSSISSGTYSKTKMYSHVQLHPSIMQGTLDERRKRLSDLCNNLFKEYKERFPMMDLDYKKKPGAKGIPALSMEPCNLKMFIYVSQWVATWECGNLDYRDTFLK